MAQKREHEIAQSEAASVRSQEQEEVKGPQNNTGQQQTMQMGLPNIIGNVEDLQNLRLSESMATPQLGTPQAKTSQPLAGDEKMYKDITPTLRRAARTKSKSPL